MSEFACENKADQKSQRLHRTMDIQMNQKEWQPSIHHAQSVLSSHSLQKD